MLIHRLILSPGTDGDLSKNWVLLPGHAFSESGPTVPEQLNLGAPTMHYDEEELQNRRGSLRGNMCIEQDEAFYFVAKRPAARSSEATTPCTTVNNGGYGSWTAAVARH